MCEGREGGKELVVDVAKSEVGERGDERENAIKSCTEENGVKVGREIGWKGVGEEVAR